MTASPVTVDTIEVTPDILRSWRTPDFYQPYRLTQRFIRGLAKRIAQDGGAIPGVLTLGVLDGVRYLLDDEQRREAFYLSGCAVGYASIRLVHCETLAEMTDHYQHISSAFVEVPAKDRTKLLQELPDEEREA